jgi:DNA-binding MarR family transcriptional regulator
MITVSYYNSCIMQHSKETISNENIKQFRKSLRKLQRKLAEQLDGDSVCCGVTIAQRHVLLAVEEKEHTTVTELAAELELDKSTLSRTIESLVVMGLVNRETNSDNRRSQHIRLTGDGEKTASGIHNQWRNFFMSLFEGIPKSKHAVVIEGLLLLANSFPSSAVCCALDVNPQLKKKGNRVDEHR